jgi:hypothetical protein
MTHSTKTHKLNKAKLLPQKNATTSLIIKSGIFVIAIIAGCVSIILIVSNINNYFESEKEVERLLAKKIENEKNRRQAQVQEREQQEKLKKYKAELAIESHKIELKAKSLAQSGKLLVARTFLKNYSGKFASDTHQMRLYLAKKYYSQHKKNIAKKRKIITDSIVKFLLKKDYSSAAKVLKEYPPPIPENINIPVQQLCKVDIRIAETFSNDIGGLIMIKMKNEDIMSAKLTGIKGCSLRVIHSGKNKLINISDIALQERRNRINFLSPDSKAIYLGIEEWNNKAKQQAGKSFRSISGPLSQGLINITGTFQGNEAEVAGRIEFFRILRGASLIDDDLDAKYIAKQLKAREVDAEKDRTLNADLDKFKLKYEGTYFIQKQKSIIADIYKYLDEKVDFLSYSTTKHLTGNTHDLNLLKNPPGAFWDVTPSPSKSKRFYAKLKIGKYNSVNIVLDKGKKVQARIAFDDDVDFTDKKPVTINKWTPVILLIKYDNCKPRKYCVEFIYSKRSKKLIYRTSGIRTGKIKIGQELYDVSIFDNDTDADYSNQDSTFIIIKGNNYKGKLIRASSRQVLYSDGKAYKIKSIKPDGSHITFISD